MAFKRPMIAPFRRVGFGSYKPRSYGAMFRGLLIACVLLIATLWAAIRIFGVPEQVRTRVLTELRQRGISLDVKRFYFDALGHLVARDVSILQSQDQRIITVKIERIRFSFNWLSWWRGAPFLEHAWVEHASIDFPLSEETAILLQGVQADVELEPNRLIIHSAEAHLGKIELRASGIVRLEGGNATGNVTGQAPPEMKGTEAYAQLWKKVSRAIDQINAPIQLQLKFDVSSKELASAHISLAGRTEGLWYEGIFIPQAEFEANYDNGLIRLEKCAVSLARGKVEVQGVGNLKEKKGDIRWTSNVDWTLASTVLPPDAAERLKAIRFPILPRCDGTVEFQWKNRFNFLLRTEVEAKTFQIGHFAFENLNAMVSWDGVRWMFSDALIRDPSGELNLELLLDVDRSVKGTLQSSIDFTHFRALAGAGAQPFLNGIHFKTEGPQVKCRIEGRLPDDFKKQNPLDAFTFTGDAVIHKFEYTNGRGTRTAMQEVKSPFEFSQYVLHLPHLIIQRVDDENASAEVWYDFKNRLVQIKDGKGRLNVQRSVPIFGGKLELYTKPYVFLEPPDAEVNGIIDLDEEKGNAKTNLHISARCKKGMEYVFLGKTLVVSQIDARLDFKGRHMNLDVREPTSVFGGKLHGILQVDMNKPGPAYDANFEFADVAFQDLLKTYFDKEDVTGKSEGQISLKGRLDDWASMEGDGEARVVDGDVYQIPFLGAFSTFLSAIIPNFGYSKASNARAEFSFSGGSMHIKEIDITSTAFAAIGHGSYNYIADDVDMSMRVNIRGPMGIPFFLFSKLFEYEGHGTLRNTKWGPKVF